MIFERVKAYLETSAPFSGFLSDPCYRGEVGNLEGFVMSSFLANAAERLKIGRLWALCPTEDVAADIMCDLAVLNPKIPVIRVEGSGRVLYTPWSGSAMEYEQVRSLSAVLEEKRALVVVSLRAFSLPVIKAELIKNSKLTLKKDGNFDPSEFSRKLVDGGYVKVPSTVNQGEFTVRGEVVDIYPFGRTAPIRVSADWDTIGSIKEYNPLSQATGASIPSITISLMSGNLSDESFSAIGDYVADEDSFVLVGDARLETSFKALETEARALYRGAYQLDSSCPKPDDLLFDWHRVTGSKRRCLTAVDIWAGKENIFTYKTEGARSYFGNFNMFRSELEELLKNGWKAAVFTPGKIQKARIETMLDDFEGIEFFDKPIDSGFAIPDKKAIAFLDSEIFSRRKMVTRTLSKVQSSPLDSFTDLNEGDFVVHVNYGIGQFVKIDRVKLSERERDYIKLLYADNEFLYVPIEQANFIQRYIGGEGNVPKLDKLGSSSWSHKKEKARKAAEELADYLIGIYAKRQSTQAFAYGKDTPWQLQFEAAFPYEETLDQLQCIEDVKHDMEKPIAMDRLVCGDVGYGKTEIAFRAAFKAIMGGKQVAFLAPTTILVEQHYRNFVQRVGSFPVKAALLSRMVSKKEQSKILRELAEGSIDIIFGTHRILQKDVKFSNLGLLVVDEEQRFGVKDKERIKAVKTNIDCLAMSATPIPRTLYMSLLKIRDLSILNTAPITRRETKTFILEYSPVLVEKAIREEIARNGQVFFLHNRVETLEATADMLRHAMPEFIIKTAHGQMDAEDLDETMRCFVQGSIQVLVSTTIIENGIDIPNVNTIIIDRADNYGVSQLYQLRGRVGRSDRQAYAYLLYPPDRPLSELAVKRLKIISENTSLGAGFKVAMKDMEIRGTGNLLGREQSGQLASVGLDMYLRILDEAVKDLQSRRGEQSEDEPSEVFLELDYTGFIPDSYIKEPSVKFEIYKKIASVRTKEQLDALTGELTDRFGPIPEEVSNLLYIAQIKIVCSQLGISHLKERNGTVTAEFTLVSKLNIDAVIRMVELSGGDVTLDPKHMNHLIMKTKAVSLKDKALFILERLERLL